MLKKYNRYKVLKVFLDKPLEEFGLREISRLTKIAPLSIKNYLKEFEKEGLIDKYEKKGNPVYHAKRDDDNFIFYKKLGILYELHDSGLVDYLWTKLAPDAIILYGSSSKGESIETSDVDIFVIGKDKKINVDEFEKKLGKEIHLVFDSEINHIPKELKNNLINGIILKGYFKAV